MRDTRVPETDILTLSVQIARTIAVRQQLKPTNSLSFGIAFTEMKRLLIPGGMLKA